MTKNKNNHFICFYCGEVWVALPKEAKMMKQVQTS